MANFVFTFMIFLEIFLTIYLVRKIVKLEKRVREINMEIQGYQKPLVEKIIQFRNALKKMNKLYSFVTNKKFIMIKKVLGFSFEIIQIAILLKSFNLKKGLKFNPANLRKLLYTQLFRKIIEKIIFVFKSCMA